MKYLKISLLIFIVSATLQMCREEDERITPGKVQFSFNAKSNGNANGRTQDDFPAGSYLLVSMENSSGVEIFNKERMDLLTMGDGYISHPVELNPGSYEVTEFLVVSPYNEVLYATPKAGSPLASLVEHPLPISFSVENN